MTLADLSNIATIISGLAVLVSVVYLALQIRQNVRHSQAIMQQGRAGRTFELLIRWAEFDWNPGMMACAAGSPDASATDVRKFISLMRAFLVNYEDSYLQHQQYLLDGEAYENVEAALRAAMTGPGHRVAWKVVRHFFGAGFQSYIDDIISQTEPASGPNALLARWQAAATESA